MFDAYSLFFSKYGCSIFVINKSLISISQHIVDDHDRRQTQVVNSVRKLETQQFTPMT